MSESRGLWEDNAEDDEELARWGLAHDTAREAARAAWYCFSSSSSSCWACRTCARSASARCFSCSKKGTTGSCAIIALRAGSGMVGTASLPRCLDESWSRLWLRKLQPGSKMQHCLHMRRGHCMHPRRLHPGFAQSMTRDAARLSWVAVGGKG